MLGFDFSSDIDLDLHMIEGVYSLIIGSDNVYGLKGTEFSALASPSSTRLLLSFVALSWMAFHSATLPTLKIGSDFRGKSGINV